MHILLIHQAFTTTGNAGGTRHFEIARYLATKEHQITVITSPVSYLTGEKENAAKASKVDGINILYSYTSKGMHKGFFSRLCAFFSFMISSFFKALSVPDVDIVWGTSPNLFQGLTAWLSAKCKKAGFLFEIRDLWPDFAIELGVLTNPLLIYFSKKLEKFLYLHADRLIVNSPGFIPSIQKKCGKIPALVANGSDPEMFRSSDQGETFRKEYHLDQSFVVMYCGAHGPANDLDIVLDAADMLRNRQDIKFVLVGSGKDKTRLMENASQKKLKNVIFTPPVSKENIANVMAASDMGLAILKSIPLFKTTYPNKVFDTMAAGKPVLLQIDGVIRELVETYDAGIFIEPGNAEALANAVTAMAADRERCREMGMNGYQAICKDFSREKAANLIENIMKTMLKK